VRPKSAEGLEENDLRVINVTTFIAADVGDLAARTTVVQTRLTLGGDAQTVVAKDHADNAELLALHQAMVNEAVEARLLYLQLQEEA